jgi:hypothetical protein
MKAETTAEHVVRYKSVCGKQNAISVGNTYQLPTYTPVCTSQLHLTGFEAHGYLQV